MSTTRARQNITLSLLKRTINVIKKQGKGNGSAFACQAIRRKNERDLAAIALIKRATIRSDELPDLFLLLSGIPTEHFSQTTQEDVLNVLGVHAAGGSFFTQKRMGEFFKLIDDNPRLAGAIIHLRDSYDERGDAVLDPLRPITYNPSEPISLSKALKKQKEKSKPKKAKKSTTQPATAP